ncbi:hypothetical protein EV651_11963 [Kribbella sp. VKM Ac-2571]|uniref:hypothetical protein n=1 Tax=Kribbella sp. VKM Ac-2571 TaxID=2512222 RepID=UPI00105D428B|nr:hypothetical protein [Kribbella sp. VKM Ac-2571]TDO51136.1 hypothetical protein EV651_11963 [Kribbella sp. VKM Ac-2571]
MRTVAAEVDVSVARVVEWLETGVAPDRTFAADCFADVSLPHWRVQFATGAATIEGRRRWHPYPGVVRVERVDRTEHGFVMAFEERWRHEEQNWYCREQLTADIDEAGEITELRVYCTGDWDEARQAEHAAEVTLIRS